MLSLIFGFILSHYVEFVNIKSIIYFNLKLLDKFMKNS